MNLVVGNPLRHSLSPSLHNFVYHLENIEVVMEKFEEKNTEKIINKIRNENILLTAVTMPHKEKIINYLDEVEAMALKIASVNTIINNHGKLFGYNTDLIGIRWALNGVDIKNRNVLLLGAGGVARTVAYFIKENFGQLLIYNRHQESALKLAQEFDGEVVCDLEKLNWSNINLIVNCTPVGMGELVDLLPLPEKYLNRDQTIFDVVYNPIETKLIRTANSKNAKTISGLSMFIEQGLEQVKIAYGLKKHREILKTKLWQELTK